MKDLSSRVGFLAFLAATTWPLACVTGKSAPGAAQTAAPRASDEKSAQASADSASAAPVASASGFVAPSLDGSAAPIGSVGAPGDSALAAEGRDAPEKPACPPRMALVGRVCVDEYEDALEDAAADGSWAAHPYYERPSSDVRYRAVPAMGQFPQGYISRVESKAACEASGKRLCTKHEWQRACRGKGVQTYPYGEKGIRDRCNAGKIHLLSQMFKNPPGGMKYAEHFNSPELNKTPGFLARGGEHQGCVSELGVFDMIGNLHEWVSDTVTQDLMDKLDDEPVERRKQPWHEGNGVFMGGFYSTTSEHGPGCYFITVAHEPTYHDYSTGFRCCEDATLPPSKPNDKSVKAKPAKSPIAKSSAVVSNTSTPIAPTTAQP